MADAESVSEAEFEAFSPSAELLVSLCYSIFSIVIIIFAYFVIT